MDSIWFSIKHCMTHYVHFTGTTSREMYWKFVASVLLLWIIMGILIGDASAPYDWDSIVFLFSIIPLISATVRRIRDAGFNPWWGLLLAGPGTQVIVIIMAMFRTHTQQNDGGGPLKNLCRTCNNLIRYDAKFCSGCGQKVMEETESTQDKIYGQIFNVNGTTNTYEGELLNNVPEGIGILTELDGSIYEGEFRNGKKTGWGKYHYK